MSFAIVRVLDKFQPKEDAGKPDRMMICSSDIVRFRMVYWQVHSETDDYRAPAVKLE